MMDDASHSSEIPLQKSPEQKQKVAVQRKRAVKDPHAPTRPLSAYLCFLVEKQEEFRKADPEKQVVAEITRRVGAAWRALSEDERKKYEADAELRKVRYLKEMAEYEQTESHRQFVAQKKSKDNGDNESPEPAKKRQRKREGTPTSETAWSEEAGSSGKGHGGKQPAPAGTKPRIVAVSAVVRPSATPAATPARSSMLPPSEELNIYNQNGKAVAAKMDMNALTELRVPIMTKEFMEWSAQREKDLRQARHMAHELEIDVAGIRTHNEQEARVKDEIASSTQRWAVVEQARKDVFKLLTTEFADTRLPSGLMISPHNVEEYMAELEKTTSKSTSRLDLLAKIRSVAVKLQPYMEHLH
ncbi:hypothetical protein BV898_12931 [Hypsibius exemplaris]|uniref:HMG box domain-containing protein n=1 Tax=Hypsibius exemplaris TaxID=2072580 RepID=A0A1W0WCB1_HYPEX|nr:hypothetical protein BV898_12931 [Hypsibius exemplaris]